MKDWLKYRSSDACFLKFNKQDYSFADMNNIAYDRALSLLDFGVRKDDKIALFSPNLLDFIEAYLACYKIQNPSIILNYQWEKNVFSLILIFKILLFLRT